MDTTAALLESWDRQSRIVNIVAARIDESNKRALPSPDGWPLYEHLAHIHQVRRFHMHQLDAARTAALPQLYRKDWSEPTDDLSVIRAALEESGKAVGDVVRDALAAGKQKMGGYDHPVFFLQHLVWHEGWHIGLIFLGLRLAGQEVPEQWEETKVWAEWRND